MLRRTCFGCLATSIPATFNVPAVGLVSVAIVRISVVLPGTVGAQHREHLARGDGKIQAGQRLDVAEVLLETFGLDHHVHHETLRDDARRTE